MSLLLKDPAAILDYAIDWGRQYLGGDVLSSSSWTAEPDDLLVTGSTFDERTSQVTLSGGSAGKVYQVHNHVTTSSGREDSRSLTIRVEAR